MHQATGTSGNNLRSFKQVYILVAIPIFFLRIMKDMSIFSFSLCVQLSITEFWGKCDGINCLADSSSRDYNSFHESAQVSDS